MPENFYVDAGDLNSGHMLISSALSTEPSPQSLSLTIISICHYPK